MFAALNELIEQRIDEARRQGVFEDLPGAGRPLDLDDDRMVPEELRAAFRILKNAGFVPPEVEALRNLDALLSAAVDSGPAAADVEPGSGTGARPSGGAGELEAARARRRMLALAAALEARGSSLTSGAGLEYRRALMARFGGQRR